MERKLGVEFLTVLSKNNLQKAARGWKHPGWVVEDNTSLPQAPQASPTKQIYLMNQRHLCFEPNSIISRDSLIIT